MSYISAFCITIDIFCWIILVRNQSVAKFRLKVLKEIGGIHRAEIAIPLLEELEKVNYSDMLWQWWKPLRSFYSPNILKLLE